MKSKLFHIGLGVAGVLCLGIAALVPPAAPILGIVGTKALVAAGGVFLLMTDAKVIKAPKDCNKESDGY